MNDETKPVRTLDLAVDVDAPIEAVWKALTEAEGLRNWFPPEASVSKPGAGGAVTFSWGPEMTWTTTVDTWEPGRHLRWVNDDMMGPGTRCLVDWYLSTEGGRTRLRLVQSGFGESEGWDGFFDGTEIGWKYFLYNLRIYVEKHLGRMRRVIMARFEAAAPRDAVWGKLLSVSTGLVVARSAAIKAGDWVQLGLDDPRTVRAVVELIIDGHAIAMRIPELADALLFIELEGGQEKFGIGAYLSIYDAGKAARIEAPARKALERAKAALAEAR